MLRLELAKESAEAIFKEYSGYIYKVALFLSGSRALADDITQETFIKVFRKYHTFDPSMELKPWIYQIAVNTTRNVLRKHKWLSFMDQLPERESSDFVEGSVLKSEREKELWRAINSLGLKSKEIIVLHFFTGLKLKEVANALGIPLGTCKSRLNTALCKLRKQLADNQFNYFGEGGDAYESF